MRHAFHGALSRVFIFTCLVIALAVPLAAHAQDVAGSGMSGGTLTTGIPWLDKSIAVLAAVGAICSLLSHVISPDTVPGKIISWMAGNFGKDLKAKPTTNLRPNGFARVWALALIAVFAMSISACALIAKNFGPTLAADELNCETAELAPLRDALVPQAVAAIEKAIQDAFGGDVNGAVAQGLGLLESAGKTALGDQWAAVLCAEQVAVNDYERAHADAGVVPGTLQVSPFQASPEMIAAGHAAASTSAAVEHASAAVYAAVKAHLAAQPKHPKQ